MTSFTNGQQCAFSDNTADKGGQGAGFRPHELLEAALASCMNIWLRMYADNHSLPLDHVTSTVMLKRDLPGESLFEYQIELAGVLTAEQRGKLFEIAQTCPVRKTLSGKLSFSPSSVGTL